MTDLLPAEEIKEDNEKKGEYEMAQSSGTLPDKDGLTLRCLIENSQIGAIIGKQGLTVKGIRESSEAFVSILKAEFPHVEERILVLRGLPAQVARAAELIVDLLSGPMLHRERKLDGLFLEPQQGHPQDSESKLGAANGTGSSASFRLLVHRSAVGAIIGKGGALIQNTQAKTRSRIQVGNEPLPQSSEKTVTVSGAPSQIGAAVHILATQLRDSPLRPGTKVYPYVPGQPVFAPYWHLQQVQVPQLSVPLSVPQQMPLSQALQSSVSVSTYGQQQSVYAGTHAQTVPMSMSAMSMSVTPAMHQQQHQQQHQQAQGHTQMVQQQYHQPFEQQIQQQQHGHSHSQSPSLGVSNQNASSSPVVITHKLAIPTVCAGAIIGKGGAKIRALRVQSQCRISLADPDPLMPHERIITLIGSQQGLETAIYMIRQLITAWGQATAAAAAAASATTVAAVTATASATLSQAQSQSPPRMMPSIM